MPLIQELPQGALDIVGDIHGEIDALPSLLNHLGYDSQGNHPQQRRLVFVGDFCDRGPNSLAVLLLVEQLVKSGNAFAILGNHELNLLRHDPKEGSGWFFDERLEPDNAHYAPFVRPNLEQKQDIIQFLMSLPLALERADIRIIHAAWQNDLITKVKSLVNIDVLQGYNIWNTLALQYAHGLLPRITAELNSWGQALDNPALTPPMMFARAKYDSVIQMMNPIKVMTSGVERQAAHPFYVNGKWRFAHRHAWWNDYDSPIPVVVGHYWRHIDPTEHENRHATIPDANLFHGYGFNAWHGKLGNVFCVDFSVGGRWKVRHHNVKYPNNQHLIEDSPFKLAALQWPEKRLVFDEGFEVETIGFAQINEKNRDKSE